MPESVTDRPTNSWEPIFLLAKSAKYFFDNEAVKEQVEEPRSSGNREYKYDGLEGHETKAGFLAVADKVYATRNQRNVWSLGPEPYSEAHFATFPTEIPRRAILAGTSARGCCPKCLAPWERVVERKLVNTEGWGKATKNHHEGASGDDAIARNGQGRAGDSESRTVGWQPTCKCDAGEPVACTVLDCFGGSGTTGAVAIELGRKSILCELNPEYLPLIEKRTNITPGLALA